MWVSTYLTNFSGTEKLVKQVAICIMHGVKSIKLNWELWTEFQV